MEKPVEQTGTITVEARMEKPDIVRVTLKNTGTETVKVIRRMALCYPEMKDGEVYLLITDKESGKLVGEGALDYNRAPARKENIIALRPGEEISADFSLREWYTFPKGDLELQAIYSCENSRDLDPELLKGEYRSEKISFTNK